MSQIKQWGATPEEWFHFDLVLGRTHDLLPVVCNPDAPLSPDSKLKALGKTPSHYNGNRQVVGLANWTKREISDANIERWSQENDYGICSRMGKGWLALDCDSESPDIQDVVQTLLLTHFGELPPRRYRVNSNKCLYLLAIVGEYRKRIHRLSDDNGIIELLADGQQAVIAGTHPSGARIEWDGGLPDEPSVITPEQLEVFWSALAEVLPVESSTEVGISRLRDRSTFTPNATDEVSEYLDANNWTLDFGSSGERYIRCPFEDGHSGLSDPTSTVYFPAGTAGFELGHFKCLHASCAHRNDGDYLNQIGFRHDDFDDLEPLTISEEQDIPALETDKVGHFLARYIQIAEGDLVCDLLLPPQHGVLKYTEFSRTTANIQIVEAKGKTFVDVAVSNKWLSHPLRKTARGSKYLPGQERLITDTYGLNWINTFYMPEFTLTESIDQLGVFLDHMAYILPVEVERNWFIQWMAFTLQRPETRCKVTPLLVAKTQGTGRGWIVELMEALLGAWNCTKTELEDLATGSFGNCLNQSLMCSVEESKEGGKNRFSINASIRSILTEKRLEVNLKYGAKGTIDVFTNFFMMTNHTDALVIPQEDRRINVFSGPDEPKNAKYYDRLYGALNDHTFLAQVYSYLIQMDLSSFNWKRSFDTPARREMIESNQTDTEKLLLELLSDPPYPAMAQHQIFYELRQRGGIDFILDEGVAKKVLQNSSAQWLTYQPRVNGVQVRPWLLVKNNKLSNNDIKTAMETCEKLQSGF
ncbi:MULTISPECIES: DUF5906 domain-containing protein [Limnobaculum]|uniref:DUF5906 domain-containing protein n=1 Tax=Limnobaculum TaxID=2172100 RepID=UPI001E5665B2|nr:MULTISPECIES: DUF5906 domain-containing protein [Limnobaculum]